MDSLDDQVMLTNCFAFGYGEGFRINDVNAACLLQCNADGAPAGVGFRIMGGSNYTNLVGCLSSSCSVGFQFQASAPVYATACQAPSSLNIGFYIDGTNSVMLRGCFAGNGLDGVVINNATARIFVSGMGFQTLSGVPIKTNVATSNLFVGDDNDFGNVAAGTQFVPTLLSLPFLASATTLAMPGSGEAFVITGATTITNISGGWAGRTIRLHFQSTHLAQTSGINIHRLSSLRHQPQQ